MPADVVGEAQEKAKARACRRYGAWLKGAGSINHSRRTGLRGESLQARAAWQYTHQRQVIVDHRADADDFAALKYKSHFRRVRLRNSAGVWPRRMRNSLVMYWT